MNNTYRTIRNSKGKNILVVKGFAPIEMVESNNFDAIFIEDNNLTKNELSLILQTISPLFEVKCWLKPCFLTPSLKDRVRGMDSLIDGYASNIDDKEMNEKIDQIAEKLELIEYNKIEDAHNSSIMLFIRICKYAISRGHLTFTIAVEPEYAEGHSAVYSAIADSLKGNTKEDFIRFNHSLLELGLAEKKHFVDRIHNCPHCHGSHLYFMECCPKCQSSNLQEQPVLHHFRCANISPEYTYAYDGQLRCPKCHQFLRHIGVDYDRPSNVYICQECKHSFLHTQMKVRCSTCKKTMRPSNLHPYDVYYYEFTDKGLNILTTNEAVLLFNKDLWNGYSRFDSFISQISLFSNSKNQDEIIYITKFRLEGANVNTESIKNIISNLQIRYHYNNLSYNDNFIYMGTKAPANERDELWERVQNETEEIIRTVNLKYTGMSISDFKYFTKEEEERTSAFIRRIQAKN